MHLLLVHRWGDKTTREAILYIFTAPRARGIAPHDDKDRQTCRLRRSGFRGRFTVIRLPAPRRVWPGAVVERVGSLTLKGSYTNIGPFKCLYTGGSQSATACPVQTQVAAVRAQLSQIMYARGLHHEDAFELVDVQTTLAPSRKIV